MSGMYQNPWGFPDRLFQFPEYHQMYSVDQRYNEKCKLRCKLKVAKTDSTYNYIILKHSWLCFTSFQLKDKTVYKQYYPAPDKEKGAYWLNDSKTVRILYFREKMIDSGEDEETLN